MSSIFWHLRKRNIHCWHHQFGHEIIGAAGKKCTSCRLEGVWKRFWQTTAKQHHNTLERKTRWYKLYFFLNENLGDYCFYHSNSKRENSYSHRQLSIHLYSRMRSWINQWLLAGHLSVQCSCQNILLVFELQIEIQLSLLPMFHFSKTSMIPRWSKLGLSSPHLPGSRAVPIQGCHLLTTICFLIRSIISILCSGLKRWLNPNSALQPDKELCQILK